MIFAPELEEVGLFSNITVRGHDVVGLSYRQCGKRNNSGFNGVCLEATLTIKAHFSGF